MFKFKFYGVTDEPKSGEYLLKCVSVAVQRGNIISVQGSTDT